MIREIPGPIGRLEALLDVPADGQRTRRPGMVRAAVVFGHPLTTHGGTMHTKVVYQSAKALARIGCAVLRFNFRGAGASEGVFDDGIGEQDDFRAALDFMRHRHPDAPLWAAGMSFGSWVGLTVAAADPGVSALIGVATPVCRYDFTAIGRCSTPKFFVHGERDEICPLRTVQEFYGKAAEPKELVVIDAADHLFDGKASEVGDALDDLLRDWPEAQPNDRAGAPRDSRGDK